MKKTGTALIRRVLPRRPAPWRIMAGPLRGRTIVTSWHDYPAAIIGRTELPLLRWFAAHARPGETWLDVGGHYGYTAIALGELVGPAGRVFTFEPVVATAGCIARTRAANAYEQITVVPIGLGAPDTLAVMRLPLTRGMADLTLERQATAVDWETIQVARFDWLWPRLNGGNTRVDGIKIDVQGMELDVLDGMADTLREHQPALVVEVHAGVDRNRLLTTLSKAGYSVVAAPIEQECPPGDMLANDRSYAFAPAT